MAFLSLSFLDGKILAKLFLMADQNSLKKKKKNCKNVGYAKKGNILGMA